MPDVPEILPPDAVLVPFFLTPAVVGQSYVHGFARFAHHVAVGVWPELLVGTIDGWDSKGHPLTFVELTRPVLGWNMSRDLVTMARAFILIHESPIELISLDTVSYARHVWATMTSDNGA